MKKNNPNQVVAGLMAILLLVLCTPSFGARYYSISSMKQHLQLEDAWSDSPDETGNLLFNFGNETDTLIIDDFESGQSGIWTVVNPLVIKTGASFISGTSPVSLPSTFVYPIIMESGAVFTLRVPNATFFAESNFHPNSRMIFQGVGLQQVGFAAGGYGHFEVASDSVQLAQGVPCIVKGDLHVPSGKKFILNHNAGIFLLGGRFTGDGTYRFNNAAGSWVTSLDVLSGPSNVGAITPEPVAGATIISTFTVSRANATFYFNGDLTVTTTLSMLNGKMVMPANSVVTVGQSAQSPGSVNVNNGASWITGASTFRKFVPTTIANHAFPLGTFYSSRTLRVRPNQTLETGGYIEAVLDSTADFVQLDPPIVDGNMNLLMQYNSNWSISTNGLSTLPNSTFLINILAPNLFANGTEVTDMSIMTNGAAAGGLFTAANGSTSMPNVRRDGLSLDALNNSFHFAFSQLTPVPLAAILLRQKVEMVHETAVLQWTTASENNSAGFHIWVNNAENWQLYTVVAASNSPTGSSYEIKLPNDAIEVQIAEHDLDGTITLFPVLAIHKNERDTKLQVTIWPNPANHEVNLECNTPVNGFKIMDSKGADFSSKVRLINSKLDVSNLPTGVYIMQLASGERLSTTRFTKN